MTIPMIMAISGVVLMIFGMIVTVVDLIRNPRKKYYAHDEVKQDSLTVYTNHLGTAIIAIGAALLIIAGAIGHFSN